MLDSILSVLREYICSYFSMYSRTFLKNIPYKIEVCITNFTLIAASTRFIGFHAGPAFFPHQTLGSNYTAKQACVM